MKVYAQIVALLVVCAAASTSAGGADPCSDIAGLYENASETESLDRISLREGGRGAITLEDWAPGSVEKTRNARRTEVEWSCDGKVVLLRFGSRTEELTIERSLPYEREGKPDAVPGLRNLHPRVSGSLLRDVDYYRMPLTRRP